MCEFVNFSIAKKLKEKGFPQEPKNRCQYYEWDGLRKIHTLCTEMVWYESENKKYLYSAPTISQVLKWLREEKKMFIQISLFEYCYDYCILDTTMVYYDNEHKVLHQGPTGYSYDEAVIAGIEYVIDNLI